MQPRLAFERLQKSQPPKSDNEESIYLESSYTPSYQEQQQQQLENKNKKPKKIDKKEKSRYVLIDL